jgi:hypothetical protein
MNGEMRYMHVHQIVVVQEMMMGRVDLLWGRRAGHTPREDQRGWLLWQGKEGEEANNKQEWISRGRESGAI